MQSLCPYPHPFVVCSYKPTGFPSFISAKVFWVNKGRMWSRSLERVGSKVDNGRTKLRFPASVIS